MSRNTHRSHLLCTEVNRRIQI